MSDLEARIAEVLAHNTCRANNPKADHPIWGYLTFSEDQREFLRGRQAQTVAELMPLIREREAEALREAAETLEAYADKKEREVVKRYFWSPFNVSGSYWAVKHNRILARWLRARAARITTYND